MRVLITGATGFLGRHLCARFAALGHRVTACHRAGSRTEDLARSGIELFHAELDNLSALRNACEGQDVVVHAAADIKSWSPEPESQIRTNVDGANNIALACLHARAARLVFVSSVNAIGIPGDETPADENFEFNLSGARFTYHLSKKRAEDAIRQALRKGLDAVIVNPASIFGPSSESAAPAYRGAELMRKGLGRSIVPVFAGGRCIAHVKDAVEGILAAIEKGAAGHRYILGGENLSFREIARRSARAMNERRLLIGLPRWSSELLGVAASAAGWMGETLPRFNVHHADGRHQYYRSDKARNDLGYSPRPFDSILNECLAWTPPPSAGRLAPVYRS